MSCLFSQVLAQCHNESVVLSEALHERSWEMWGLSLSKPQDNAFCVQFLTLDPVPATLDLHGSVVPDRLAPQSQLRFLTKNLGVVQFEYLFEIVTPKRGSIARGICCFAGRSRSLADKTSSE